MNHTTDPQLGNGKTNEVHPDSRTLLRNKTERMIYKPNNTNESQTHQDCMKEARLQILSELMYMIFSQRDRKQIRGCWCMGLGKRQLQKGSRKFCKVLQLFYVLTVMVVTPFVCFSKTHRTIH